MEKGKGGYWELGLDPNKCDKKRIRNRKLRNNKQNNVLESNTRVFPKNDFEKINKKFEKKFGTRMGNNNTIFSKPSTLMSDKQSSVLNDPMPSLTLTKIELTEMPNNENCLVNKDHLEINSLNVCPKKEIYQKDNILGAVLIGSAEILDARQAFNNLSYHDSDSSQQVR